MIDFKYLTGIVYRTVEDNLFIINDAKGTIIDGFKVSSDKVFVLVTSLAALI